MNSCSRLSDFIRTSNSVKTVLKIGEPSPETASIFKPQERGSPEIVLKPKQWCEVELPLVFSHMSILLIETLSETQHGELMITSRKANHETFVNLKSHINHRHHVNQKQLQDIHTLYEEIIEAWIAYRQSHNQK
ncbi:hypothetical protein H6G80_07590 [Nostoc sp. FACHB-87]|uniref:hypothetical protein n=1 Tax=Nostocales TaxID=1161 RepID=UPI001687ADCF|nr:MULTISPECIES: hypothetical protein [Nostocales]MBD2302902.1 hypothetical protein [Nostoc sp. FACHB-190]MBD2453940.1 hypothetical protein [Nostoc sp. FACHB-87]MBD2476065.1 hypothetical protein [Anabaena sp. FACHB-83]MBD2489732.1 hypothetical protein [Aulosira sp. FACHB-615]